MVQFLCHLNSILVMNPIKGEHLWWLKVFQYPFGVMEPTQVVELVHPVEFVIVEKQQQV